MNESIRLQRFLTHFLSAIERSTADAPHKENEAANVRVVHAIYEAMGRGDLQAFAALLADDAILEILGPAHSTIAGRWQGRDEIVQAVVRNFSHFADQYPELEHVVARGDNILVIAEETGRYLPTNEAYNVWWLQAFVVKDGKIARVRQASGGTGPWESNAHPPLA
jgi:ketosteroid isomerase-like protein